MRLSARLPTLALAPSLRLWTRRIAQLWSHPRLRLLLLSQRYRKLTSKPQLCETVASLGCAAEWLHWERWVALADEETLLFDYVEIEIGSSEYLLLIYVFWCLEWKSYIKITNCGCFWIYLWITIDTGDRNGQFIIYRSLDIKLLQHSLQSLLPWKKKKWIHGNLPCLLLSSTGWRPFTPRPLVMPAYEPTVPSASLILRVVSFVTLAPGFTPPYCLWFSSVRGHARLKRTMLLGSQWSYRRVLELDPLIRLYLSRRSSALCWDSCVVAICDLPLLDPSLVKLSWASSHSSA